MYIYIIYIYIYIYCGNHTLFILHILTYYDFLRILPFLEIWIVIKEVGVSNILFACLRKTKSTLMIYLYFKLNKPINSVYNGI